MKKVLFVICSLVILFPSCSQDEMTELQPNSTEAKIKAYKEYAEKLADKYGVDMQLNEENLHEIVNTLSLEQMDQDFMAFSHFQKTDTICISNSKRQTKKLGIKRRISMVERDFVVDGFISHTFEAWAGPVMTKKSYLYITLPWDCWKHIVNGQFETNQHSGTVRWHGSILFDEADDHLKRANTSTLLDIFARYYTFHYHIEVSSPMDDVFIWSISPTFEYNPNF